MAKYTEKLVEKIASLIEEDTYSISEICTALRISRKTFYEWKSEKPDFAKAVEDAENRRDDSLVAAARRSLRTKVEGYTLTEVKETYVLDDEIDGAVKLQKRLVTRKQYAPDTASVRLVLEREDTRREKKEKGASHRPPMMIVVKDQETKEVVEKLREKIKSDFPLPLQKEGR